MLESAKKKQTLMNVKGQFFVCKDRNVKGRATTWYISLKKKMSIFSKEITEIYNDQQKALQVGKVIMF